MPFSALEYVRWTAGNTLEAWVCILAFRRGLFRRLPVFTTYLLLILLVEVIRWVPTLLAGLESRAAFWTYWVTQGVLLLARGAVIAELCYRVLSSYPGVWRLCQGFLFLLGFTLGGSAALAARDNGSYIAYLILTAERGLEITVVGILISALAFCRYYGLHVERLIARIALGLAFYSLVSVAINSILNQWVTGFYPWWTQIRMISFDVSYVIWLLALWKPLPAPSRAPELLEPGVYSIVSSQMSGRLRELNARLEEMLR